MPSTLHIFLLLDNFGLLNRGSKESQLQFCIVTCANFDLLKSHYGIACCGCIIACNGVIYILILLSYAPSSVLWYTTLSSWAAPKFSFLFSVVLYFVGRISSVV